MQSSVLRRSLESDAQEISIIGDIIAAGGTVSLSSFDGVRVYDLQFTELSRASLATKVAWQDSLPHFPFFRERVDYSSDGAASFGDSLLKSPNLIDITDVISKAVSKLTVDAITVDADSFIFRKPGLSAIRNSSIRRLYVNGQNCDNTWVDELKGMPSLREVRIAMTSIEPNAFGELLISCPAIHTVSYLSNFDSLSGLNTARPYRGVRHLQVSCRDRVDPEHLQGFDRLESLHIAGGRLSETDNWPAELARQARHIVLPILDPSWVKHLGNFREARILSFTTAGRDSEEQLLNVLPRLFHLQELEIDCQYDVFPLQCLVNLQQLTHLTIKHSRIEGTLAPLANLKRLHYLNLHGSPFDPRELHHLADLQELKVFDVSNIHTERLMNSDRQMYIIDLRAFEQRTNLEKLHLDGHLLSPVALETLKKMTWLKLLSVTTVEDVESLLSELNESLPDTLVVVGPGPQIQFNSLPEVSRK